MAAVSLGGSLAVVALGRKACAASSSRELPPLRVSSSIDGAG